jgi:hypothetical protein
MHPHRVRYSPTWAEPLSAPRTAPAIICTGPSPRPATRPTTPTSDRSRTLSRQGSISRAGPGPPRPRRNASTPTSQPSTCHNGPHADRTTCHSGSIYTPLPHLNRAFIHSSITEPQEHDTTPHKQQDYWLLHRIVSCIHRGFIRFSSSSLFSSSDHLPHQRLLQLRRLAS